MKRKLLSGALALVMLAGCTAPVPDTQKLPDDGGEKRALRMFRWTTGR